LPNHFEVLRDILQHLGNIFAERLQRAAAVWARFLLRQDLARLAWQMRWQRLPCAFRFRFGRENRRRARENGAFRSRCFEFVQAQLQLLDLRVARGQLHVLVEELFVLEKNLVGRRSGPSTLRGSACRGQEAPGAASPCGQYA
jgi:hypothetical protein